MDDQKERLEQEEAAVKEPVSYTHLDVYKRQVPAPCWNAGKSG